MNQELILKMERYRLNLSHYQLLQDINKGTKILPEIQETACWATLIRKGYVAENSLTESGQELWLALSTEAKKKPRKKEDIKSASDSFDEWWGHFPSTDRIMDGDNILYPETRGLRTGKKEKVKEKYIEILNEGVYTHKELLDALTYEVDMRIQQSLDKGENKLTFMKGSLTYLNQASYESFIDLAKIKRKPNSKSDTIII